MKKLITAIAAIATSFGLFAADAFTTSVLSDIQSKTNNLVVGYDTTGATMLDDTGDVTVNWFADSLKTDFTTKMETYEQPELKVGEDEEGPYKYLAIDTDVGDPVLRTFNNVVEDTGVDNFKYNNIAISDHGVFIDTETTFTLFDTVPDAPGDSKILVWARETEADEDAGIVGATNLMVSCGWYDAGQEVTVPTNYVLDVNGIVPEQMYRLTIRADKDGTKNTKFRVYLNGVQLKTVALDDQDTTLDEFPSLVDRTQELGAAGFGGTGSLKGIDLLTEADAEDMVDFAADKTYLTVSWNEGVTGFTVDQIGFDPQVITVTGSGTTNLIVHSHEATVTPTYLTNPKYKFDSFAESGTLTLNDDTEGIATVTIERYAGHNGQNVGTLAINAVEDRKGASLVIEHIDGTTEDIGVKPYLTDVMAYIWGRMTKNSSGEPTPDTDELGVSDTLYITLVNDEVSTNFDFTVHGNYTEYIYSAVVLDLNGHSVSNTVDTQCASVFDNWTDFTIQDTSVTGGGMIVAQEGQDVIANNYSLTIKAAENADNPIRIRGPIYIDDYAESTKIEGGLFTVPVEGDNVTLPDLKKWSATPTTDDYYSLVDAGAKTVTITTNPAIGEFNVLTNGEPVVVTGNTATIGELDPFTVTFTKADHYNLGDTTGWTLTDNVYSQDFEADETAVTLPTGTAITFNVTFANGQNSTITPAAGTSNLIEGTVVAVIATAAQNYEFADESYEGWTKEQDGTLTKSYTVTAIDTVTAPDATAKAAIITVPETLPDGVELLVVSQSDDEGETWTAVTKGDVGYAIVAGNMWKVEAVAAEDVRVVNPIRFGTATPGEAIAITAADFDGKITKYVWVVIAEDAPTVGAIEKVEITTNGYTFVADPSNFKIETNTIVTISATVAQGYNPATFTSQEVEIKNGQFTATNSSITVTVTTTAIGYPINVTDGTADPATFTIDGATVALAYTGTPATGESFSTWTASAGTVDGNTLTIPAGLTAAITVTPNFTNNVYAITYIYTDGTDPVVVTANTNPANFTYGIGVPSFDAAGLTYDTTKYENPQFSPTSIGTDVAEAKTVTVTFTKKQTEPIPPLPDNPTEQQKKEAVDAVVAKNAGLAGIVTTENYSAFRDWARATGTDPVVAEQAVIGSTKAGVSFQLSPIVEGATLFENEPVVSFTAIAGNGNNWDVTLQLKDGASGEEVELAIGDAKAHFAQFIKKGSEVNAITGTCDVSDIVAAVKPGDDQTSKQVKLTVVPPTGGKGFIKFLAEKPTQSETP